MTQRFNAGADRRRASARSRSLFERGWCGFSNSTASYAYDLRFHSNCDPVDQALHTLRIVLALAEARTSVEIVLPMTNDRLHAEMVRYAGPAITRGGLSLVALTGVRIEADYSLNQTRVHYSSGIAVRRDSCQSD